MALGYRSSELCAMTPPQGGNTPIVLVTQESSDEAPLAHKTMLVPEAKSMSPVAFSSMTTMMQSLEDADEYMDVSVEAPMVSAVSQVARSALIDADDTVSLHFKQSFDGKPDTVHLMYAIGMMSSLGIHTTRACFEIQPTSCESVSVEDDVQTISFDLSDDEEEKVAATVKSSSSALSAGVVGTLLSVAALMMGM